MASESFSLKENVFYRDCPLEGTLGMFLLRVTPYHSANLYEIIFVSHFTNHVSLLFYEIKKYF